MKGKFSQRMFLAVMGIIIANSVTVPPLLAQESGNLITLHVGVRTKQNQVVSGLKQEHFSIYEGKESKPVKYFRSIDEGTSIGFLIDMSGSMRYKEPIQIARLLSKLVRNGNPSNEYFALTFSESAKVTPLINDAETILTALDELTSAKPSDNTRLFDALRIGLETMEAAKHRKRAVILLSDLADNASKTKFDQLKWLARESNVLLYGLCPMEYGRVKAGSDPRLSELLENSGGSIFYLTDTEELQDAIDTIGFDLKNRYTIRFEASPSRKKDRDEWRKFEVKLVHSSKDVLKSLVFAREGYYAPKLK